ncbi:O-antigen ligase family protein [Thiorhodovibrio frisius]|uniref:Lipid A core-O-antigen ligase-like enyme n=1 Tax=Thiorhodovibrio frisius TaxID=631362 RepID=H8Z4M8_9GAMM|nr:O-antigen ligase family protein [Thiorhodovibrio frisius]EIC20285.1 lipid A core-O-antigen ligase-like enyme [Thiorhodovibrio frisius]WPL21022.1 Lipid A core - O-antigen ligase [Thiorhodovibrio frisius]
MMRFDGSALRLQQATLWLFGISLFLIPAGLAGALVLLWLGFLLAAGSRETLGSLRDPAVLLVLAFVLYSPARQLIGQWLGGESTKGDWGGVGEWMQLAAVFPFALALRADAARLRQVLVLALIGLLICIPLRADWELLLLDPGQWLMARDGFGFVVIAFGLYCAAALLGVLFLRWPSGRTITAARWLAGLVLAQGLLFSQSRASWLAFLAALVVGLWLRRSNSPGLSWPWAGIKPGWRAWAAVILLAVVGGLNASLVLNRLTQEADSAVVLLEQPSDLTVQTSIGLRWRAQQLGLNLWLERPWFGWGADTTPSLIAASAEDYALIDAGEVLVHLHNSYLEILVQFGLVGLVLFFALVAALFQGVLAAWRQRLLPADLAIFLICLLLLTLIWNFFNFRMLHQDWRGFWALVAGSALSFGLAARRRFTRTADHNA